MLAKLRKRLTFANVVSLIALFVALGGSSYAAITITGKNVKNPSLTGKDIKNSSLTGSDVKNSSLTTSDIKNHSLRSTDFKAGQLPAGPRGADGKNGTNGFGVLAYPFGGPPDPVAPGDPADAGFVPCPTGTFPTGGDANAYDHTTQDVVPGIITESRFDFDENGNPDGWFAAWENPMASGHTVDIEVDVACANATTVRPNGKRAHVHITKRLR
jgi:hypothetical protein